MLQRKKKYWAGTVLIFYFLTLAFIVNGQSYFSVTGKVTDQEGEPLPGASIIIHELNKGTVTDENGQYRLGRLKPGKYHFHISFIGYQAISSDVQVRANIKELDFSLEPSLIELSEVLVEANPFKSGGVEQSLTVRSVNRDFIEKRAGNTFVDAIGKLPGVSAINTGIGIAKPVIRGLSFNRVLVNDKGIKQEGQQWGADHGLEIDQFEPERVEIIKGPASLLYGSDAMGGVINISNPAFLPEGTVNGSFQSIYKSNNHLIATSSMVEGNLKDRVFRVRFSTQDFGDYRVPATSFNYNGFELPIYNNALKNTAGQERNLTAMLGTTQDWGYFTLTVSNFNQRSGLFPGAIGIPRQYQLTGDGDSRNIDVPRQVTNHFKVIANTSVQHGNNWFEMDLGYQLNSRREESLPHAHGRGPVPEGILALGLQLHTLSANVRYHQQHTEQNTTIWGGQAQYQVNRRAGYEFLLPNFESYQAGAFGYHKFQVSNLFTLNGGIRFDYGNRSIDEYEEAVYSDPETIIGYRKRNFDIQRSFYNVSGGFGLAYHPSNNFNAKINMGSSFRMPTAPELSSNGVHHGTFRHEMGDSTLVTERGFQGDLNLTYKKNHMLFSVTPFFNYFQDYIYLSPTVRFSPLPEGGQVFRYAQADAIFTGFEAELDVHILKPLHLAGGVEYVWNYNLETNLPLPLTPPLSVFGELEYTLPIHGNRIHDVYLQVEWHEYAAQNRVDRNEFTTPAYRLVHLTAGTEIQMGKQALRLTAGIKNVFDRRYLNHLSRYRLLNLPEQGRNVFVSLKFDLNLFKRK